MKYLVTNTFLKTKNLITCCSNLIRTLQTTCLISPSFCSTFVFMSTSFHHPTTLFFPINKFENSLFFLCTNLHSLCHVSSRRTQTVTAVTVTVTVTAVITHCTSTCRIAKHFFTDKKIFYCSYTFSVVQINPEIGGLFNQNPEL